MPKYKTSAVSVPLPKRTREYLERGAPEGARNAELFDAACQLRDAGQAKADAESKLLERALADGLSESEARQTIQSAFNGQAREALGNVSIVHAPRIKPPIVIGPPEPIESGFPALLAACFRPDEYVAISPAAESDDGAIKPRKGVTMTMSQWLARVERKGGIDRMFGTKLGLFFRINPMTEGGSKDADVTEYRHSLVEFDRDKDGHTIPKEEQYRRIIESGLPVVALIDSGNKSLHAIVRVDAPNAEEYKRRVDVIWKFFEGMDLDKQNRNPSRLSRCPDGWRTVDGEVRRQSLLTTNFGAASWDRWEAQHANMAMPSFIDLREFILNGCQQELPSVADVGIRTGMLYAGRINEIHGEPGTGKSNVAIAFSNAVMKSGGTVLYIDPEDVPAGFTRRSLQLGADPEDLMQRCQYLNDSAPREIQLAQRWATMHRPTLVVIDGMAECMAAAGLNEDKADEVLRFIQDEVRPFAEKAGSAVLISDHVTKSWEDRGLWSRGSGAKMGRYDGVSYALSLIEAYAPGQAGAVLLTVAKDRNGGVGVKGNAVAEVHFTPAPDNRTLVTFRPHQKKEAESSGRPTIVMRRIENFLREQKEADKRTLRTLGKAQNVDKAIEIMEQEGALIRTLEGNRHVFTLPPATTYKIGKSASNEAECVPCS